MIISFGRLTEKSLLFLFVPIFMLIRRFLTDLETSFGEKNIFYPSFLRFLGRLIHGIMWLIIVKISITNTKNKQDNKDKILTINDQNSSTQINPDILNEDELKRNSTIYKQYELECKEKRKMEIKNNCKKIFLLIFVCILDFLAVTTNTIVVETNLYNERTSGLVSIALTTRLFAIALLSYFIIKNSKMYSHHYLSIIIILIVVISIIIFSAINKKEKNNDYVLKLGLFILPELLYSIMYVFGAKYLLITDGNIYKLLFIEGILGIILSIILQVIIFFSVDCSSIQNFLNEGATYCYGENGKRIKTMIVNLSFEKFGGFVGIIKIIIHFFEMGSIWLLIYNFSANHFGAIQSIPSFIFFNLGVEDINTLYILGSIIIVFMTFVYNEIIILRFCGFDKNTVDEINIRSLRETRCDFEKDDDDIWVKSNDNYLIMKSDICSSSGSSKK